MPRRTPLLVTRQRGATASCGVSGCLHCTEGVYHDTVMK
jgi:hypothetical protein